MKTIFVVVGLSLCLLNRFGTAASAGELKPHRPPGMPENELIAFDDYKKSVDSEDLADALGITQFNFQVQVPDGTSRLRIGLHLIEDSKDREMGFITLSTEKRDSSSGNVIKGAKQFRVVVMVSPLETSTVNPLIESPKLRFFAKEFLTGNGGGVAIIENPFKKQPGGVTIYNTTQLVRDRKPAPGAWEGFGTRFDLFSADRGKRIFRISFEKN